MLGDAQTALDYLTAKGGYTPGQYVPPVIAGHTILDDFAQYDYWYAQLKDSIMWENWISSFEEGSPEVWAGMRDEGWDRDGITRLVCAVASACSLNLPGANDRLGHFVFLGLGDARAVVYAGNLIWKPGSPVEVPRIGPPWVEPGVSVAPAGLFPDIPFDLKILLPIAGIVGLLYRS